MTYDDDYYKECMTVYDSYHNYASNNNYGCKSVTGESN